MQMPSKQHNNVWHHVQRALSLLLVIALILPFFAVPLPRAVAAGSGTASIAIIDKAGDGKITDAADFSLGATSSDRFTVHVAMSTNSQETFQFTIPAGFSAAMQDSENYTMTTSVAPNGDAVYTYEAKYTAALAEFDCVVTVDSEALLANVSDAGSPRFVYDFAAKAISQDGLTETEQTGFSIELPAMADYTLVQVDSSARGDFSWNPNELAGGTSVGLVHINNQAATSRPAMMTKPLQIEIQKEPGALIQKDWSLRVPLPLYMKLSTRAKTESSFTVAVCIDGVWKNLTLYTNAFNPVTAPDDAKFKPVTGNYYNLPTNMGDCTYTNEIVLTMKDNLLSSQATDAKLGTSKTIYEWLAQASAIRFNIASDVLWDPVYNGQTAESQLTADMLSDDEETYTASSEATLTVGDTTVSADEPMKMHVVNGTDTTLKVAIATIDQIQMDVTTTKTTTGAGGANGATNATNDGYIAAFGTAKNSNYSYFTNMVASYDFPWEYSPTGTITLCPLAANGSYDNERNLTCYDYEITISNTAGESKVVPLKHNGYTNPNTGKTSNSGGTPYYINYTPTLAADEWISNITVTADKVWKQSLTADTSALTSATMNHPLFYANCASKGTYEDGSAHEGGDQVQVNCSISTDQTGRIEGEEKNVTLIGPKDNIVIWGADESDRRWPIGQYGDNALEYIELHVKKYSDTRIYQNPYIEITGDAVALLSKVTHKSVASTTNYLSLRGYRLNDGTWINLSDAEAASLLNGSGDYYDLTARIPAGKYLTGLRLEPAELNTATVDTTTAPTDTDRSDGTTKPYLEEIYYLNLYDQVWPAHLGYDDTLKKTYTNIADLDSPLSYDLSFHCDNGTHTGSTHLKDGLTADDMRSATLVYGDLPQKIFNRDNDYYVAAAPTGGASRWKYYVTELANVAIDDGPALSTDLNYWGEMEHATLKFANDTIEEQRMLALTKGVSLVGANWTGDFSMYQPEQSEHAIIRYKTNQKSDWQVIDSFKGTSFGDDRAVNYFPLGEGEYVTAIEVDYPADFMYRSGYNKADTESKVQQVQLPDVGLLTKGTIPKQSPIDGDNYYFHSDEQLPYHAELSFTDAGGDEHVLPLDTETAKLQPYPTMLVDKFTSSVSYSPDTAVYQGNTLIATMSHTYDFTSDTKGIDTSKVIHPTLCYELDKNFTIADINDLADSLGISHNQITLSAKNDGSGSSILKIEYGAEQEWIRNVSYNITLPLTAKPNAQTINVVPIKNAWLTLDYDTTLDHQQEGEYIGINPVSTQLEGTPFGVLPESEWATGDGTRLALKSTEQELTKTININKHSASSMQFYGTNGSGGGIGSSVSGHDSTDSNIFGLAETLYAPDKDSSNWVIYVAIPHKGQEVPYSTGDATAPPSEFGLVPAEDLSLSGIDDTDYTIQYFIPSGSLVPSMAGLTLVDGESTSDIQHRDDTQDAALGTWKDWSAMSDAEKLTASYVRVIADQVPADAVLSSSLLLKLRSDSAKTQVDEMYAYTSLVYNYLKNDGGMAFLGTTAGNRTDTNGKASDYVEYILTDYAISGQLWQEKNFNNTFVASNGDVLTPDGMTVTLTDADNNPLTHFRDGSTVEVTVNSDGTYSVPVPSKGTYYLTLTSTEKNWLPVSYNAANIQNGMLFVPGKDKDDADIAANLATATVTVSNSDVRYVNGGIEQWGTLTIDKRVAGALGDRALGFAFQIRPDGATINRTYTGTYTAADGTTEQKVLSGGGNNAVTLADGDSLTVALPVGLKYTVSESGPLAQMGYYSTIETLENGAHPENIEDNPYTAASVENQVVEITYTEDVSDGGNEERFTNTKDLVPPTAVKLPPLMAPLLLMLLAVGMTLLMASGTRRKKRYVGKHVKR